MLPHSRPVEPRIYLSPPDVGAIERSLLLEAFDSNWIAPVGPHLVTHEDVLAAKGGVRDAIALSSGTAGLHLVLVVLGIERGNDVILPSMTFAATANAAVYLGARPCFLDSEGSSWN